MSQNVVPYRFHIGYSTANSQFLEIEATIPSPEDKLILHLPVWRPGRYELANYARYIRSFRPTDEKGKPLAFEKLSKSTWCIYTPHTRTVKIYYDFYANQLNAGGCWLDEEQLYLNFVNCIFFCTDALTSPYEIVLDIPSHYDVACALPCQDGCLRAQNYYHLIDSPLIASAHLKRNFFQLGKYTFYIWIQGNWEPDWQELLCDFERFARAQLDMMGEFPFESYHFLIQAVPHAFYHGVEHTESSVIVIGPANQLDSENLYNELLGICSHELFHVWNVCRIRPRELFPYDLTKECYFPTGFVVEGITSYYGDLFLIRAGIWKYSQYLNELNKYIKRHFENHGRYYRSLVEASIDLWLDGYADYTPGRKVSIYTKGALVALILDLLIRKQTNNLASLDDVMREMWKRFGKSFRKGYSLQDFKNIVASVAKDPLEAFFEECIEGTTPLENYLLPLLEEVGIRFITHHLNRGSELFNFQIKEGNGKVWVSAIVPGSNAAQQLRIGDEIIALNDISIQQAQQLHDSISQYTSVRLTICRMGQIKDVCLDADTSVSFKEYVLQIKNRLNSTQQKRLLAWLHQSNN